MKQFIYAMLLLGICIPDVVLSQSACSCFLLTEQKGKLAVEKVTIDNNRVEVLSDPSIVAPVFSMGEGMNGDMVKKERRGGMIIAQCKDNQLKLKFKTASGEEKPLPDMDIRVLRQMNIRINVVSGDGTKKAFLIEKYDQVKDADGPVMDMFGGKIPIQNGDFILTTETRKASTVSTLLKGKIPFQFKNGWMMLPVQLNNGNRLEFVLDMAATSTVIDASVLPSNTEIVKMETIAYSDKDTTKSSASMQGATGQVDTDFFLGKALLQNFRLNDLLMNDVNASVLKSFPEKLKKAGVVGIIGTDILKKSGVCTIQFTSETEGTIVLGESEIGTNVAATRMPFNIAGGLLFIDGKIQGKPLKFVMDTGARESILSQSFVTLTNISYKTMSTDKMITGIDGKPQKSSIISLKDVAVGNYMMKDTRMILGNVAALSSYGLSASSAILGMDFFHQFTRIQIDFSNQQLLLQH
ncbi:hypothetical protein KACHI17_00080 [Sediminibacterium sp. KACHI17]|uniref:Peptidase A2 domain-containing protein n=1 Tax=Sediminibacterium sp. KACHI17 TaxID=1751071 RepID=A0AAT9GEU7_9BACT